MEQFTPEQLEAIKEVVKEGLSIERFMIKNYVWCSRWMYSWSLCKYNL